MTMNESTSVTKDPICGMAVDDKTALHAERDGKAFHFFSEQCRATFLSTTASAHRRTHLEAAAAKRAGR
jgi:YHS domain-containing protein